MEQLYDPNCPPVISADLLDTDLHVEFTHKWVSDILTLEHNGLRESNSLRKA